MIASQDLFQIFTRFFYKTDTSIPVYILYRLLKKDGLYKGIYTKIK